MTKPARLRLPQLQPKAAKLLGLSSASSSFASLTWSPNASTVVSPDAHTVDVFADAPIPDVDDDYEEYSPMTPLTSVLDSDRTPVARDVGASKWTPDWPEPDDDYIENMMRRRPALLQQEELVELVPLHNQDSRSIGELGGPVPSRLLKGSAAFISSTTDKNIVDNDEDDEDPLTVYKQIARVPKSEGVPANATNSWFRRSGLQLPLDPLFVLQWVSSLLLSAGFFLLVRPLSQQFDRVTAADTGSKASGASELLKKAQFAGSLVIPLALVLSIIASLVDNEAKEVALAKMPRDMYYQLTWGTPAVNPMTGMCRVCQVSAATGTRHCKRCNKCVSGYDHHCRWLNTCVGIRNYRWFFASLVAGCLALSNVLAHATWLVYLAGWRESVFVSMVARFAAAKTNGNGSITAASNAWVVTAMCSLAFYFVASLAALVAVSLLLGLHVRLCLMGISTVDYIGLTQQQRQQIECMCNPASSCRRTTTRWPSSGNGADSEDEEYSMSQLSNSSTTARARHALRATIPHRLLALSQRSMSATWRYVSSKFGQGGSYSIILGNSASAQRRSRSASSATLSSL